MHMCVYGRYTPRRKEGVREGGRKRERKGGREQDGERKFKGGGQV